jgi:hypothetical protein
MRAVRLHTALVAIASGAVAACTDVCACPPTPATALLIGRVIDDTGAPTAGAAIVAYSAPAAGCQVAESVDLGLTTNGEDGSFRVGLVQGGEQGPVCVLAFARPPQAAAQLANSDAALVRLEFRYQPPLDSALIELVLKPR